MGHMTRSWTGEDGHLPTVAFAMAPEERPAVQSDEPRAAGAGAARSARSRIPSPLLEEPAYRHTELRQISMHDRPDQLDVDAHVVVDDLVPHTRDPPPRNARRRIAHLGWEVLDRLADAPEASDDRVLQMPALAEPPETDAPA